MRYCHECGAEVAPEDSFCPYCGIVLQSIPLSQKDSVDQSRPLDQETQNLTEPAATVETATTDATFDRFAGVVAEKPSETIPVVELEEKEPQVFSQINKTDEPETVLKEIDFQPDFQPDFQSSVIKVKDRSQQTSAFSSALDDNQINEDLQPTLVNARAELLKQSGKLEDEDSGVVPEDSFNSAEVRQEINERVIVLKPPTANEETAIEANNVEPLQKTSNTNQNIEDVPIPLVLKESEPVLAPDYLQTPQKGENTLETVEKSALPRNTEANKAQETPGGKSPKLRPLDDGTLLNRRYEIVRRIGGGGMGAVYLAKDQNLGGVQRAVKEMIQAYVDESQQEKAVQDFRRESLLLSQLEHPSIPTIYDYFYDEQAARFYLVMKYISGGDLAARLRSNPSGKIDERHVTEWAIQVADVLDYLHNRPEPIVYRDLKPSNIMLDGSSGKAMLIDFGIARWVNKEEKGVTAVGTMGYAPPELFSGNAEPRSDIYSLGATMFHLLTGADPQSNPLLIFDFNKNPRPRKINPGLSVEMEDILLKAVEYNSTLRFESAAKMREALLQHLEKLRTARLTYVRKDEASSARQYRPQSVPIVAPSQPAPVKMIFCGFCGEKIVATDMFCAYCGGPQQVQSRAAAERVEQPILAQPQKSKSNATARLVVMTTNELDSLSFTLEKESILVGREDRRSNIFPEVDLTKFDVQAKVSRRHARIWREGAEFLVEDLKSSNGTVLITDDNKNVRLQANEPHILRHGDKLRLGETTLRFYLG